MRLSRCQLHEIAGATLVVGLTLWSWVLWRGIAWHGPWLKLMGRTLTAVFKAPVVGLDTPVSGIGIALLVLAFWGTGKAMVRLVGLEPAPWALIVLIGEVIWAMFVLILGSLGILVGPVLFGLVFITAAASIVLAVREHRSGISLGYPWTRIQVAEVMVVLFGVVPLILVLLQPTVFYDALTYHLALPKQYLAAGSTAPLPWHAYSYFPSYGEMLFTLGFSVGGQGAAQLLNALHWLVMVLLLRQLATDIAGQVAGAFTLVVAVLTPLPWIASAIVGIDTLLMGTTAAMLWAMLGIIRAIDADDAVALRRNLIAWACFCGFAAGLKYTSLLYVVAVAVAVLLPVGWRARRLIGCRSGLLALGTFVAVAGGWTLRNLITAGNPLYPSAVFGASLPGLALSALRADAHAVSWSGSIGSSVLAIITLPWRALFAAPAELELQYGAAAFVGGLLYVGIILLWMSRPNHRGLRLVGRFALGSLVAWALTFHMARFAVPALAAAVVLAGVGIAEAWERPKFLRAVAASTLIALGILNGSVIWRTAGNMSLGFAMLVEGATADAYLNRRARDRPIEVGAYPIIASMNRTLPDDARVLFIGEASSLYVDRSVIAPSWVDEHPLRKIVQAGASTEAIRRELHRLHVTHVLLRADELRRLDHVHGEPSVEPEAIEAILDDIGIRMASQSSPPVILFALRPQGS
ncbi:MAG: hypothetical protein V3T05_12365 [Myxococcota bacterium]